MGLSLQKSRPRFRWMQRVPIASHRASAFHHHSRLLPGGMPRELVDGREYATQGHLQTLVCMLVYRQQPQVACDAPRRRFNRGLLINVEAAWRDHANCVRSGIRSKSFKTAIRISVPANSSGAWVILLSKLCRRDDPRRVASGWIRSKPSLNPQCSRRISVQIRARPIAFSALISRRKILRPTRGCSTFLSLDSRGQTTSHLMAVDEHTKHVGAQ